MTEMEKNEMERALDEVVQSIGGKIMEEDARLQIANAGRMKQMAFTYEVMKNLLNGQSVSLSYKVNEPFKSTGSITVEGKELVFDDTKWFAVASEFADNFEVYPLKNGKIRLAFAFHNLTVSA